MKKETIYFDTSVPSSYYDDRIKERQKATVKFWREILPDYQVYISEITVRELKDTKDETLRKEFRKLIKDFKVLKTNEKIRDLARVYVEKGIFPERYIDDALSVAITSFYEIFYVVSWNFEHLMIGNSFFDL